MLLFWSRWHWTVLPPLIVGASIVGPRTLNLSKRFNRNNGSGLFYYLDKESYSRKTAWGNHWDLSRAKTIWNATGKGIPFPFWRNSLMAGAMDLAQLDINLLSITSNNDQVFLGFQILPVLISPFNLSNKVDGSYVKNKFFFKKTFRFFVCNGGVLKGSDHTQLTEWVSYGILFTISFNFLNSFTKPPKGVISFYIALFFLSWSELFFLEFV